MVGGRSVSCMHSVLDFSESEKRQGGMRARGVIISSWEFRNYAVPLTFGSVSAISFRDCSIISQLQYSRAVACRSLTSSTCIENQVQLLLWSAILLPRNNRIHTSFRDSTTTRNDFSRISLNVFRASPNLPPVNCWNAFLRDSSRCESLYANAGPPDSLKSWFIKTHNSRAVIQLLARRLISYWFSRRNYLPSGAKIGGAVAAGTPGTYAWLAIYNSSI